MSDPTVNKWKQRGNTWIWRYPGRSKNFEGLHLTADTIGCNSMKELFKLMDKAQWTSTQNIRISKNKFIDTTGCGYRLSRLETLKIRYRKNQVPENYWNLEWDSNRKNYILSIGEKKLKALDTGISDIQKGSGDYNIGTEDDDKWKMCLWFWWYVG